MHIDDGRTIRLHPTVLDLFVKFERLFAAGEAGRYPAAREGALISSFLSSIALFRELRVLFAALSVSRLVCDVTIDGRGGAASSLVEREEAG
jgi:hypothetical protein